MIYNEEIKKAILGVLPGQLWVMFHRVSNDMAFEPNPPVFAESEEVLVATAKQQTWRYLDEEIRQGIQRGVLAEHPTIFIDGKVNGKQQASILQNSLERFSIQKIYREEVLTILRLERGTA